MVLLRRCLLFPDVMVEVEDEQKMAAKVLKIQFLNVDLSSPGWIRCDVVREESNEFWVQLPYSFTPMPDIVAACFVALCGSHFDEIHVDLPLDSSFRERLEASAKAKITSRVGVEVRRRRGEKKALNFSGGFDSLAARSLVPDADLIALDFGGRFSREREFFHRFEPYTLATNLVDIGLNRYSWQFMGMGSILMLDELDIGTYSFGSILAGSLPRLLQGVASQDGMQVKAAGVLGQMCRNPVVGVTEIGTLGMVLKADPSIMLDVLKSVALPREDKAIRKNQLLRAVGVEVGIPLRVPSLEAFKPRREWGTSMATDLSSLYVMQVLGVDEVAGTYIDGVPDQVAEAVPTLNLDFMWRVNSHAYRGVEGRILSEWYRIFLDAGLRPYDREDWGHADAAVALLQSSTKK